MRVLPITFVALAMLTGVASGDDEAEDADGDFVALPKRSIGITLHGHGTRIDGRSESGFGPTLEFALGRGRWQYFVEGGFATAGMNRWTTGVQDMHVDGKLARGGLGTRWLARQFRPDSSGGIELFLMSLLGAQRYYLEDMTRLTRAELAAGFGLQARLYKRPRLTFRLDARVLFTPDEDPGFMGGFGFAW